MNDRYANDVTKIWEYQIIKKDVNEIYPNIFDNMTLFGNILHEKAKQIVEYLLSGNCDSSNDTFIVFARWKLWQIEKGWLIDNFESILRNTSLVDLNDDYEYNNLGIVIYPIPELAEILINIGLEQSNEEVKAVANDYKNDFRNSLSNVYNLTIERIQFFRLM